MRLLHTSDWHLGARVRGIDRTPDQLARLQEIFSFTKERNVDLLLVAGDVFDEYRPAHMDRVLAELAELIRPELDRGLRAVFVAGNHDKEHLFPLLNTVRQLVGANTASQVAFCDQPSVTKIDSKSGEQVNLLLIPYPSQDRYGLQALTFQDGADRRRQLAQAARVRIREMADELKRSRSKLPTVVVAHLLIRGLGADGFEISEADDIPLDAADLPNFTYVAMGHIHKAIQVGARNIRYSGSIERMDFGEAGESKSVVLVEIGPKGLLGDPEVLPLHPTRLVRLEAEVGDDLEAKAKAAGDLENAIVGLTLRVEPGQSTFAMQLKARALFPRLCQPIELQMTQVAGNGESRPTYERKDVPGTVHIYLNEVLENDPDQEALLAMADQLLEAVS